MSEITLCTSTECPVRRSCYRTHAKTDTVQQSYENFEYTCNEDNGFVSYIPSTLNDVKNKEYQNV